MQKQPMKVFIYCDHEAQMPVQKTPGSAGYDIAVHLKNTEIEYFDNFNRAYTQKIDDTGTLEMQPRCRYRIPLGIYTDAGQPEILAYFAVLLRSGMGWKKGLMIPNAQGVIDLDYRGQWHLVLFNPIDCLVSIEHGQQIAQLVATQYCEIEFQQIAELDKLSKTKRGAGGFGSTGNN